MDIERQSLDVLIAYGVAPTASVLPDTAAAATPHTAYTHDQIRAAIDVVQDCSSFGEAKSMLVASGICGHGSGECLDALVDGVILCDREETPAESPVGSLRAKMTRFFGRMFGSKKMLSDYTAS